MISPSINSTTQNYVVRFTVDSIVGNFRVFVELDDFSPVLVSNVTTIGEKQILIPAGYLIRKIFFRGTDSEESFSISFVQLSIDSMSKESFAYNINQKNYANGNRGTFPNSLQKQEHLYNSLANPMRKTSYSNPLSSNSSGLLHVFASKRFIVIECVIDYIRRRRRMSLSLNQSTELPKLAEKVIGETVTSLHEAIQSGNFQTSLLEARKSN